MEILRRISAVFIAALALMLSGPEAGAKVFSFGVEWGANAKLGELYHYNYIDNSGGRVDDKNSMFSYHANGHVLGKIGINLGQKFRLDVNSGYMGIADGTRVVPVTLRANIMPKGRSESGFMYFLDGGTFFNENLSDRLGLLGAAGFGYRIALTRNVGLDFLFNVRCAYDHPDIVNPDGGFVLLENIRQNNAEYFSLGFSISLDF